MCDRIGIINQGNLIALETTENMLNKIQTKMDYYQVMLNYLDSILKNINNRTFQIKNAIEWQKFIRGYSD